MCIFPVCMLQSGSSVGYRPSNYVYSGTLPTNIAYAYDTTGTTIDYTTYNSLSLNSSTTVVTYYGFPSANLSGTLVLAVNSAYTRYSTSPSGSYTASSSILIKYSVDGGTNYTTAYSDSGGTAGISTNTLLFSIPLSNVSVSQLYISMTITGQSTGPISDRAIAIAVLNISDILFY